ncbi:MAG TPA: ABC transporter permease [Pseudonocardiaceae bacterium]|nr:ABC transporter permease [Pseudonocardiaceae bacterium]
MAIAWFVLKRLAGMVVTLFVVTIAVFGLLDLSPGSLVATLLGNHPASPAVVAAITVRYHLDDPFPVRYLDWLTSALHGDFGQSVQSGENVSALIGEHLPITLQVALYALVLVVVIGIPAGMLAGMRRGGVLDKTISGVAVVAMSAPAFAIGILLIYVLGVRLSVFPVFGAGDAGFVDRISHLTLPALALAATLVALLVRQTRAAVLNVMSQDYITFARARGLSRPRILLQYALRNTALPVTTATGLMLIAAIAGTVLVEQVFSLPGIGNLMVQSVDAKDVPVVQGVALCVGAFVVVVNFLVDMAALAIDPRTRTAAKG